MIATLTRILILLQLAALAAISILFVRFDIVATPALALLAGTGIMASLRAAIIFNNYVLSDALKQRMGDGSRAPLTGLAARIVQECWCSMLCWFRLFPFARPGVVTLAGDGGLPVLLLHGFGGNSGFWRPLAQRLRQAGISHATVDLEPVLGGIDDYADLIETQATLLCVATGATQLIVVGHSMGGLAARAWIRCHGSARVAKLITLGTPHFGSWLASYGTGRNAKQMVPPGADPDAWLNRLAASETPALRARVLSLWSRHDNIVSPQNAAVLPGAENVALDLIGHVALGFDPVVLDRVVGEISSVRRSRSTA
jgi:pimeloyl-ACP methyl ester carboxylesterase